MTISKIPSIPIGKPIALTQRGSWPASVHVFDEQSVWAVRAALAAQRPLLVRGEPGAGKVPLCNLFVDIAQKMGLEIEHFGSSTGRFA